MAQRPHPIYMPDELWEALSARAVSEERSVAWLVRKACEEYLSKGGSKPMRSAAPEVTKVVDAGPTPTNPLLSSRPVLPPEAEKMKGAAKCFHAWGKTEDGYVCSKCKEVKT